VPDHRLAQLSHLDVDRHGRGLEHHVGRLCAAGSLRAYAHPERLRTDGSIPAPAAGGQARRAGHDRSGAVDDRWAAGERAGGGEPARGGPPRRHRDPGVVLLRHTTANGLCRMCVVEVEGARGLQAACVTPARPGAVVHTESADVVRARRTLLEMLASAVDLSEAPDVVRLMAAYGARPERFAFGERRAPALIDDNPMFVRDYAKCVLCWRCVQVCAEDAHTHSPSTSPAGASTAGLRPSSTGPCPPRRACSADNAWACARQGL